MAGIADLLAGLFSGPDYQSNNQPVMSGGRVNWGDPDKSSDFFRADRAMLGRMPAAAPAMFGGDVPLPPPRPAGIGVPRQAAVSPAVTPTEGPAPAVPPAPEPVPASEPVPVDLDGMRRMSGAALSMEPEPGYTGAVGQILQQAIQEAYTPPVAAVPATPLPGLTMPAMARAAMRMPIGPVQSNALPPEALQAMAAAFGAQSRPSLGAFNVRSRPGTNRTGGMI